jgi:hypothetical protein
MEDMVIHAVHNQTLGHKPYCAVCYNSLSPRECLCVTFTMFHRGLFPSDNGQLSVKFLTSHRFVHDRYLTEVP